MFRICFGGDDDIAIFDKKTQHHLRSYSNSHKNNHDVLTSPLRASLSPWHSRAR